MFVSMSVCNRGGATAGHQRKVVLRDPDLELHGILIPEIGADDLLSRANEHPRVPGAVLHSLHHLLELIDHAVGLLVTHVKLVAWQGPDRLGCRVRRHIVRVVVGIPHGSSKHPKSSEFRIAKLCHVL